MIQRCLIAGIADDGGMAKLQWGILGTGRIAGTFSRGVAAATTGEVIAVGSRRQESADRFAQEHGIRRAHGSYEALLADREVQAVYIAMPHPLHHEWTIRAVRAGKHVLCEKPLAMNRREAAEMVAEARAGGVLLMEAFMYRCHPQTAKVVELVKNGALGRIRLIRADFCFRNRFNPNSRLWNKALGGGGVLDVGGYPVSFARLVAGAVQGAPFADPVGVTGVGGLHPVSGVDVLAEATLRFADGLEARVACGIGSRKDTETNPVRRMGCAILGRVARIFRTRAGNTARIEGSGGWLQLPEPWSPTPEGGTATMVLRRAGASPEEIRITAAPLYALEADAFAAALATGALEVPQMTLADSLGNMATLDRWRQAIGLSYEADRAGADS